MADIMDMKALAALFLLAVAQGALALDVDVNLVQNIDGNIAWLDIVSGQPQRVYVNWENLGSIDCASRARIDFYNVSGNDTIVYTAWSPLSRLRQGFSADWTLYSDLPPGTYAPEVRIYHCNEIFDFEPRPFEVRQVNRSDGVLAITDVKTFEDRIDVYISSSQNVNATAIIPVGFPLGWIMESNSTPVIGPGETKVVTLGYEPGVFSERRILFKAATEDGKFGDARYFTLRLEQPFPYDKLVYPIILVILVATYLYYKKSRK